MDRKTPENTEVTAKEEPVVTNGYTTPKVNGVREEVITRDVLPPDVVHSVQLVIETMALPTKHYVQDSEGSLVEIPVDQIPGSTSEPSFKIVPTSKGHRSQESIVHIGHELAAKLDPDTLHKRSSMTKEAIPKAEPVRRYEPILKSSSRRIGAPVSIYDYDYGSDSDDVDSYYTTIQTPTKDEEDFLFNEDGYGIEGTLPGLTGIAPIATYSRTFQVLDYPRESSSRQSTTYTINEEEEAAKILKRRKEAKERLRKAYEDEGIDGVQMGMRALNVLH